MVLINELNFIISIFLFSLGEIYIVHFGWIQADDAN